MCSAGDRGSVGRQRGPVLPLPAAVRDRIRSGVNVTSAAQCVKELVREPCVGEMEGLWGLIVSVADFWCVVTCVRLLVLSSQSSDRFLASADECDFLHQTI